MRSNTFLVQHNETWQTVTFYVSAQPQISLFHHYSGKGIPRKRYCHVHEKMSIGAPLSRRHHEADMVFVGIHAPLFRVWFQNDQCWKRFTFASDWLWSWSRLRWYHGSYFNWTKTAARKLHCSCQVTSVSVFVLEYNNGNHSLLTPPFEIISWLWFRFSPLGCVAGKRSQFLPFCTSIGNQTQTATNCRRISVW